MLADEGVSSPVIPLRRGWSLGSLLKPESAASPVVGPDPELLLLFSGDFRMTTGGGLLPRDVETLWAADITRGLLTHS